MRLIGNLIWLVCGGFVMAVGWWVAGLVAFITIVGIPWGRACFVIGLFTLWPFGQQVEDREKVTGREDIGTGPLGLVGNILWFLFGGWWLALGHLAWGLLFCISILGIPFGIQHLKLAGLTLAPIGKTIVAK